MPIDARIPLGATGPDPAAFTNALAAGMKMRQFQNKADRLARKDELAEGKANALSAYFAGDRSPESKRALGAASPEGYIAVAKHEAETGKAAATTDKTNIEAALKKLDMASRILGGVRDEGSYQWAKARGQELGFQVEMPEHYDPAWVEQTRARGMSLKDELTLKLREANTASQIKYRDSMQGKPMVVQTPGAGLVSYDPQDPTAGATPVPGAGPSPSEIDADAAEKKRLADEAKRNQLPPATLAKVRDKLNTIDLIEKQLQKVEDAFEGTRNADGTRNRDGLRNTFSAGPGGGYLPTPGGQSFDATVAAMSPFLRQLTRTPGEGAMSDYESKLVAEGLPSRGKYEDVTAQQIQQWKDNVQALKSGYSAMLAPAGGGATTHADTSPDPAKFQPMNHGQLLDELMR